MLPNKYYFIRKVLLATMGKEEYKSCVFLPHQPVGVLLVSLAVLGLHKMNLSLCFPVRD